MMMKYILCIFFLFWIQGRCRCSLGSYWSMNYLNSSVSKCLNSTAFRNLIIKLDVKQTGLDKLYLTNLVEAKRIGLATSIYMRMCRAKDPVQQVADFMSKVKPQLYDMVWIGLVKDAMIQNQTITDGPIELEELNNQDETKIEKQQLWEDPCSWYGKDNPIETCQFLLSLLGQFKRYGVKVGVSASRFSWIETFKTLKGCPVVNQFPLWWVVEEEYEQTITFDDYQMIGGWQTASLKMFKFNQMLCSSRFGFNYFK